MNKLPTKQIYLLTIIIVGIIALSVYSTYALFTFESSTSDIVSIHTPNSLQISENIYEYQQLVIEPNSVTTTDIDIYNRYDYNTCYSIWYKVVGKDIDESKVQIFENSNEVLTSSGILAASDSIRVKIVIINDNEKQIKVNLGTVGSKKDGESCSLNITSDKKIISASYNNLENLNDKLLAEKDQVKEEKTNYITYKDEKNVITYKDTDKLYISEKFTYSDELFTLEEPTYLTLEEIFDEKYSKNKTIYFCKENEKCSVLYKINELEKEVSEENNIETDVEKDIYYNINVYDKFIGYLESTNGLRNVNEKDYIFYGDNPDNYIYYNCENSNDTKTCELWRIIGLFYNKETDKYNAKIIKNESIGTHQFDQQDDISNNIQTNIWQESSLHKYLNEEYKFVNNYDMYIDEYNQEIERIPNLETDIKNIKLENQKINSKVNLLNLSDYLYTSICQNNKINEYDEECLKNNWLNNIELEKEWTITSKEVIETIENNDQSENSNNTEVTEEPVFDTKLINYVYSVNNLITESNVDDLLEVRPVIFLKSRVLLQDGEGTFEKPYIIK